MFLQEWLLRSALAEVAVDSEALPIKIDHWNGVSVIGDIQLALKYPLRYLNNSSAIPLNRKYRYVFSGNMGTSGGRSSLLQPFMGLDSFIEKNNTGRDPNKKFAFNESYYTLLRSSWFALCPHQQDWKGPSETAWTYRFVEACFSRTLPVCFRAAPCGKTFLRDFQFYWDDDDHTLSNYESMVEHNFQIVCERHFLVPGEIEALRAVLRTISP